ncbi:hypothetical protein BGZ73_006647 [Actinomortierella ambigua]|nr:hypothetical protein BGZ73_006647 [Actinomortierella ambigua]
MLKTKILGRTLSKYGHLVHEITFESKATERFYNLAAANCASLTTIRVTACDTRLWVPLENVLMANPGITVLHYEEQVPASSGHRVHALVRGLAQLQELKLDQVTSLTWTDLMQLGRLSQGLSRLELDSFIDPATCNVIEDPLAASSDQDSEKQCQTAPEHISATRFGNLKTLCIRCSQDDRVLSKLLGHCPGLKSLEFVLGPVMTLTTRSLGRDRCCPDLQSLTIKIGLNVKTESPLTALVGACPPGRLEQLEVRNGVVGAQVFRAIASKQAESFRILRLNDVEKVDGYGLGSIFAVCSRLEEIEVTLLPESFDSPEIIDCRHLLRSPWILCTCGLANGAYHGLDGYPGNEEHTVVLSDRTRLRELRLPCHDVRRGRRGATVRASGFSWTLEQGLGQMSALNKLQVFDIGHFEHNMSFTERQWMRTHWPRLKEIKTRRIASRPSPDDEEVLADLLLLALHFSMVRRAESWYADSSDDEDSDIWETDTEGDDMDED